MAQTIIGIMGPGSNPTDTDMKNAYEVGKLCAKAGYTVMTGGRKAGVMEAGLKGAKEAGGQTIGILPSKDKSDANQYADIVIVTGLNSARNFINALTSDVMVACGVEAGTLSEIALALKDNRPVVLMTQNIKAHEFLGSLRPELVSSAETPVQAFEIIQKITAQ